MLDSPVPICFVAMPFKKKPVPNKKKLVIDFDKIYKFIEQAVSDVKLECVRADTEMAGGFVQSPMYESLLLGEYVIADLTLANPNVMYEIGVRHGSGAKSTILICAEDYVEKLPFDLKPFRVLIYKLDKAGNLGDSDGRKLQRNLGTLLKKAIEGQMPPDNPLSQLTVQSTFPAQHEKTDTFLQRMRFASEIGESVHLALNQQDDNNAVKKLHAIEKKILRSKPVVVQLHTAILSVYLGYREKKAYKEMVSLYDKFPKELQQTAVAIEQLALAINRLAEQSALEGNFNKAKELRNEAIYRLEKLSENKKSSETYGILGRIYKDQMEAEMSSGNTDAAMGALDLAIEMYEQGFRLDPRDYYPGVNAVTLRLRKGSAEDYDALSILLPAVRFSVERAPTPTDEMEKYWQKATGLELACAASDWKAVSKIMPNLLAIHVEDWLREATIDNLKILKNAFKEDPEALKNLDAIIDKMNP